MNATLRRNALWFLLILLLVVLIGYLLWGKLDEQKLNALGTLAAALAAIAALLISFQSQQREEKSRLEAQQKEDRARLEHQEEVERARRQQRETVAAHFMAQVGTWLSRKDLGDVVLGTRHVVAQLGAYAAALPVRLLARESIERISGSESIPNEFLTATEVERERVDSLMQMPAVRAMASIPNIWETHFGREDAAALGAATVRYFLGMAVTWSNLTQMVRDVPPADEVTSIVYSSRAQDAEQYLGRLATFIAEFDQMFVEFRKLAEQGIASLSQRQEIDAAIIGPLVELMQRSQLASPKLRELSQWPSLEKSLELGKQSQERHKQAAAGFAKHDVEPRPSA